MTTLESANGVAVTETKPKSAKVRRATAEEMGDRQRDIAVSEFFAKNRHLLGFDNPRKALLTTVKEAVDNSLDACEEAGILPSIHVEISQLGETRFKVTVRDNGPGIVRKQIEHVFGRLLYGSKFHRLKMSRGQQGIGISAAGMYGLMTTGQPLLIVSKIGKKHPSHEVVLKMDTSKNRADIVSETEHPEDDSLFPDGHGTQVTIELEGRHQKGRQSVDEYLEQTAIANPHASFTYVTPENERMEFPRGVEELPPEAKEIKPHPKGIELGTLIQMMERTERTQLGSFLQEEFCRVSPSVARELCERAGVTNRTWIKQVGHKEAEAVYKAIQEVRIMAPSTDCLVPIGTKALLSGLLKGVKAEFFSAATRPADVYRGNPFQIEVGIAFGGELPKDESARVIRFANRVPLLYQQSACCSFKSIVETNWRPYGLSQGRDALPEGPLVIMIHMASAWVPFTSESKEAVADYDEIRKEMRLALQEAGRKLGAYIKRRQRMKHETERRGIFERYIGETARACEAITGTPAQSVYDALMRLAKTKTEEADQSLDDEGQVLESHLESDESVVIVENRIAARQEVEPTLPLHEALAIHEPLSGAKPAAPRSAPALIGKVKPKVKPKAKPSDGNLFGM
ncbi:MAG: DNA topoisomerase VI subunit B [Phycisphaerales bacterium]|nr:DNA topoisomerase VI subunit B [Phycisphaerales bacterium]